MRHVPISYAENTAWWSRINCSSEVGGLPVSVFSGVQAASFRSLHVFADLRDALGGIEVSVSELAKGVPVGGELDYLDEGTLAAAIKSRRRV